MSGAQRTLITLLATVILLLVPRENLHGQQPDAQPEPAGLLPRSALAAGGLDFVVPLLGHAYAGDVGAGIGPALASAGAAALFFVGYRGCGRALPDIIFGLEADTSGCDLMGAAGVGYIVTRVWGAASASSTATARNRRLADRADIRLGVAVPHGLVLSLSARMPLPARRTDAPARSAP